MTGAVMAYGLVVGALVAAAAAFASHAAGRWSRFAWLFGLVALVGLTALRPRAAAPDESALRASMVEAPRALARSDAPRPTPYALPSVENVVRAVRAAIPARLDRALALAWAATSLLAAAWIGIVHARVRRERRAWRRATIDATRVSVSPSLGPAVVGVTRPEIVVPDWLLARPETEQRLVVAHEREHLQAGDQLALFAGVVAVALLPWHPAAWWMLSRLRLAVELDCDRRLLRRGAAPRDYGSMLIDLADRRSALPLGAPALADVGLNGSHLERRIRAMTTPRPRRPLLRASLFGALAVAATLAACEARVPTAAEIEKADVGKVQKGLAEIPGDALTEYRVDGRVVTEAEAKALPADRIAMMEVDVMKSSPEGAKKSTVSITTTERAKTLPAKTEQVDIDSSVVISSSELSMRRVVDSSVVVKATGRTALRVTDGAPTGFTLIDGVRATAESMKALSGDDIVTVEVLKGAAARTRFPNDPAAAGGVILITTKRGGK